MLFTAENLFSSMSLDSLILKEKLENLVELGMYLMKCEFVPISSVLKIIVFSFVSYIIESYPMSAVICYNKLIQEKNIEAPLSRAVKCKLIVNHILHTFDLVLEENGENILKAETIPVTLTYRHVLPAFGDRFKFYLTVSFEDDDFSVFLRVNMYRMYALPTLRNRTMI